MHRFACAAASMLLAGCATSPSSFECSTNTDCGNDGRCEPTGFCSFPDEGCASGYRYGELAESLSNQCVIEDAMGSTSADPSTSSGEPGSTSTSSSGMESTSSTGYDPTNPIGESSSGTTMGIELFCLAEEFDGPPAGDWLLFTDSSTPISIEDGQLELPIDANGDIIVLAGMRANDPVNMQSEGWARTIVTGVATNPDMTTSLSITDGPINIEASRSIRITANSVQLEGLEAGNPMLFAAEPYDYSLLPLTLEILALDGEVVYIVASGDLGVELHREPTPPWFEDAYVNITAGNPTAGSPQGVPSFDRIELCGAF